MSFVEGSPQHVFGSDGEQTVEQWLKQQGFFVTRLCTIRDRNGGSVAPMMMGAVCNVVLPDYQVIKARKSPFYVEVKHKKQAPLCYKLGNAPVHGIGRRSLEQYRQVEELTGAAVWLVVLEALTGELLALRAARVAPDDEFGSLESIKGVDDGGMVYWRKSRFVLLAELARIQGRLELEGAA